VALVGLGGEGEEEDNRFLVALLLGTTKGLGRSRGSQNPHFWQNRAEMGHPLNYALWSVETRMVRANSLFYHDGVFR
jgi:hypothetical protein